MELRLKINADHINAFKTKNVVAKNILSVVKGEIQNLEKAKGGVSAGRGTGVLPDKEVIRVLIKTAKSLKEVGDAESLAQLEIIESYLPKELTREDIEKIVKDAVESGKTKIGDIMKEFDNAIVDRSEVTKVIKEVLQ